MHAYVYICLYTNENRDSESMWAASVMMASE